jgi:small subunit ribosomal protein S1
MNTPEQSELTPTSENSPETPAIQQVAPADEAHSAPAVPAAGGTEPAPASEPAPAPAVAAVTASVAPVAVEEPAESFADLLSAYEQSHKKQTGDGQKQLTGTVVSITAEQVFLDIGYKTEGVLPRSAFEDNAAKIKVGDSFAVSSKGRNEEGYYSLTRHRVATPVDWTALEAAFANQVAIVGTVTGVVKGGITVDVGVRAFCPASRTGTHDAAEMEKLVGTEITCRITKLETQEENVVVDRRVVLEEEARVVLENRFKTLQVGDVLPGTVRTLMPYGAFIDLGGLDGLLHVGDISWSRVNKPEDVLSVGQQVKVRLLKIDPETKKLSLGLKQLEPEPWETVPSRYQSGQRVTGTVVRLMDFGAFVELEAGVEGLIHISEMAWNKRVRHPKDMLKEGEQVEAVILSIKPEERRIALGLKQTLADPWVEVPHKYPVGSQVTGTVVRMMAFGAFVQIEEGIEGLVHISEIVADRRLAHPSDELKQGQEVKAQVLAIDTEKKQIKLSMKQLIPTSIDEFIAESKVGDKVSGRVVDATSSPIQIELGEGVRGICHAAGPASGTGQQAASEASSARADLGSLTAMLQSRWKGNAPAAKSGPEPLATGQIRSFRIVALDPETKKVEVELA